MVGCDFSGLIFGDLTDSHADSPGSIPVTATKDRHPLPVTRSRLRRRPAARRQAGMTTKTRASAGEWRGPFAPRGVGGGRALSRGALTGAAADARRLPPLPAGRWWPAVTWVSGTAVSRSVAPSAPVTIVRRQSMPRHHRRGRGTQARSARFEPAAFCKEVMTPLPRVLYSATLAGSDDPQGASWILESLSPVVATMPQHARRAIGIGRRPAARTTLVESFGHPHSQKLLHKCLRERLVDREVQ